MRRYNERNTRDVNIYLAHLSGKWFVCLSGKPRVLFNRATTSHLEAGGRFDLSSCFCLQPEWYHKLTSYSCYENRKQRAKQRKHETMRHRRTDPLSSPIKLVATLGRDWKLSRMRTPNSTGRWRESAERHRLWHLSNMQMQRAPGQVPVH